MSLLRPAGLLLLLIAAGAAELTVGSGKMYAKPSLAAAAAHDGDTISIDAGTYTGDVCAWTQSNLVLRGVGGRAHLAAAGAYAQGKGTWVLAGSNTTVENIEFSGSAVPDWNGAGIRLDGAGLTVRNCYFHDNENGILTSAGTTSDVLIEHSEFASNGHGDGYSHNLYIGNIRSLVFRYNYSHHAKIGHNLKSRARSNTLIGNRLMDEASGTSSYVVDIPNGGLTFLIGNLIQQGPATSNHSAIIRYGEEGGSNPLQHLYVINNTIVNDYAGSTSFLTIAATTTVAQVENNIFLGLGTAISGTATSSLRNLITTTDPLLGRSTYDYRLAAGSAAIDAAADPGSADGQALLPVVQYVHPLADEARSTTGTAPDIGAYEAGGPVPDPVDPSGGGHSSTSGASGGGGCGSGGASLLLGLALAVGGLRRR